MKMPSKPLLVAFTLTAVRFSVAQADVYMPINRPEKAADFQRGRHTAAEAKPGIVVATETGGWVTVRLTNAAGEKVFAQEIAKKTKPPESGLR